MHTNLHVHTRWERTHLGDKLYAYGHINGFQNVTRNKIREYR